MLVSEESPASLKAFDVSETSDLIRFNKSLQELREIRSQLHYAANYCESTFLESKAKKEVVESTKEYICRAMVTVVDHLGNVSSNLTSRLSDASSFSNANTELRVDSLQQRIMSCGRFGSEFAMAKVSWSVALPRYHSRYLMSTTDDARKSSQLTRALDSSNSKVKDKPKLDREEGLPLFLYTFPMRPSLPNSSKARDTNSISLVPVQDGGPAILYKAQNPTFQFQGGQKKQCTGVARKSGHGSDVLALIRRIRRSI